MFFITFYYYYYYFLREKMEISNLVDVHAYEVQDGFLVSSRCILLMSYLFKDGTHKVKKSVEYRLRLSLSLSCIQYTSKIPIEFIRARKHFLYIKIFNFLGGLFISIN